MTIREINEKDLHSILKLYTQLHDNLMPEINQNLSELWKNILHDKNHHIIVAVKDEDIISSCVLIIISNLTHSQRPYALIENVITDRAHRKCGLATACLDYAKKIAEQHNCYKIMLMTGSKNDSTLRFYQKAGYNAEDKTAFIQWI